MLLFVWTLRGLLFLTPICLSVCISALVQYSKMLSRTGLHFTNNLINSHYIMLNGSVIHTELFFPFFFIYSKCFSLKKCRKNYKPLYLEFLGSVNPVSLWSFHNIVLLERSDRSTYGMSLRRDKVFVQTMEWSENLFIFAVIIFGAANYV